MDIVIGEIDAIVVFCGTEVLNHLDFMTYMQVEDWYTRELINSVVSVLFNAPRRRISRSLSVLMYVGAFCISSVVSLMLAARVVVSEVSVERMRWGIYELLRT